ncbi:hypothetical protein [Streptomyces anthocyanicus]|uniref:hypothetical protein n=1 Tax=Streptomyces anthocyanicus TaxID=68174 RepID=UPI0037FFD3B9
MPHHRSPVEPNDLVHFGDAFAPPMGRADIRSLLKQPWEQPPLCGHLLLVFGPPVATASATSRTP